MVQEEWRPIKGFEGYYSVSDVGDVLSLHQGERIMGWEEVRRDGKRHKRVRLYNMYGEPKSLHVCRLVLTAFVRPPEMLEHAVHKDGNTLNDCLDNLAWGAGRLTLLEIPGNRIWYRFWDIQKHHRVSKYAIARAIEGKRFRAPLPSGAVLRPLPRS